MHEDYVPDPLLPLQDSFSEDLYEVEIFSFAKDRKIAAIKFIRSVTAARNKGESLYPQRAKEAIEMLESGEVSKLIIAAVPTYLRNLVNQAAHDSSVNINEPAGEPLYL